MKKARKVGMGILGSGMMLGGGSLALSGIGGTAAGNAGLGLVNMSKALPVAGSIGGAGMVMSSMKGLGNIMKSGMKRRR